MRTVADAQRAIRAMQYQSTGAAARNLEALADYFSGYTPDTPLSARTRAEVERVVAEALGGAARGGGRYVSADDSKEANPIGGRQRWR
jgi:hypothetical protein